MLLSELLLVLIVDYICVVPITASIVFPVVYVWMSKDTIGAALFGVIALIMLFKHVENLQRIRNGTEFHFSFLWKKNKEFDRLEGKAYDPLLDEQRKKD